MGSEEEDKALRKEEDEDLRKKENEERERGSGLSGGIEGYFRVFIMFGYEYQCCIYSILEIGFKGKNKKKLGFKNTKNSYWA